MIKEKQIEEMAADICRVKHNCNDVCNPINTCNALKYARRAYMAGYRKQEWISVDERLPEDMYGKFRKRIIVLVCTESGKVSTASRQRAFHFDKTKLEWQELDTFEWNYRKKVTHWMPLPEPPKGE